MTQKVTQTPSHIPAKRKAFFGSCFVIHSAKLRLRKPLAVFSAQNDRLIVCLAICVCFREHQGAPLPVGFECAKICLFFRDVVGAIPYRNLFTLHFSLFTLHFSLPYRLVLSVRKFVCFFGMSWAPSPTETFSLFTFHSSLFTFLSPTG